VTGFTGTDDIMSGPGNDTISASDGQTDKIDCGGGTDNVTADKKDHVKNCENVVRK
jgi:hypothetical protein